MGMEGRLIDNTSSDLTFLRQQRKIALPCGPIGGLMTVREYLVLKHDGSTLRFPVRDGDVDEARLRAALAQRPQDDVVAVTDDAYIRVAQRSSMTAALQDAKVVRQAVEVYHPLR